MFLRLAAKLSSLDITYTPHVFCSKNIPSLMSVPAIQYSHPLCRNTPTLLLRCFYSSLFDYFAGIVQRYSGKQNMIYIVISTAKLRTCGGVAAESSCVLFIKCFFSQLRFRPQPKSQNKKTKKFGRKTEVNSN